MAGRQANSADAVLGRRLREMRGHRSVSQAQMGAAIGVSAAQYQKYERGVNRVSATDLFAFARLLGVTVTDLLDPTAPTSDRVCSTCNRDTEAPLFDGCMRDPCPRGYTPCY